jgi:LPS export ABC transporter protein LptC
VKPGWPRLIPLLLIPALGGLFYTFQQMDNAGVTTPEASPNLPRYTVMGADMTRLDADGFPMLHGTADSIDYYDDQSGHAQNLTVDLIDDDNKTWHLTSPAASLPAHQHRFMLEGPVVADGRWPDDDAPLSLHTDHLWVDPDQHLIDTDAPVHLVSTGRNGDAVGMRSNWAAQTLQLLHNVKMTYEAPQQK